jgi:hypothetical protein
MVMDARVTMLKHMMIWLAVTSVPVVMALTAAAPCQAGCP